MWKQVDISKVCSVLTRKLRRIKIVRVIHAVFWFLWYVPETVYFFQAFVIQFSVINKNASVLRFSVIRQNIFAKPIHIFLNRVLIEK